MRIDYLVVGAGAAGCALAARLSQEPTVNVVLLEKGSAHPKNPALTVPRAFPLGLRPPVLSTYATSPLDPADDPDYWVRGSGLGGSTLLNGMMYVRGEPALYDAIEAAGNPGWGWSAFASAYAEIEANLQPSIPPINPLSEQQLAAMQAIGMRRTADINDGHGDRCGPTPATIHHGRRMTAARAFLHRYRTRPNLRVLTGVAADALVWSGDRVVGVRARRGDTSGDIHARTVVMSAGAIETPLLLERSGIGHAEHVQRLGVPLRISAPQVGEVLTEQRGVAVQFRLARSVPGSAELAGAARLARAGATYLATRGGPLARAAYDIAGITGTDTAQPIQLIATPFALADGPALRPTTEPGMLIAGFPIIATDTYAVHSTADPSQPRIMRTSDPSDDALANVRSVVDAIAAANPLGDLISGPGEPTHIGTSIYHAVGSAAMGPNADSVVDHDLRVRGADGLRIADLSVFPFHPSGATAAPAMALGHLAARRLLGE